ncbi:AraC family transcriptional regulator [Sinisalibacter aestuarii]|uniref:AraC family transcriptional regulator n=1 Tax=Sinisalibacter aestuarii TaxID=2949426 RepID=A0ABQ5LYB2_9RHOB|nr:AraC family transcriptional regulator [Sinisalibacter aestuarii]GKY89957.1 AraC family transcriptional regulator [Sinisalibacter aestuarii]
MERRQISPGFVRDALRCLDAEGIDPAPLLDRAGIARDLSEPVSNLQYGALWRAIAAGIGDEFFGEGHRPMRPGSFALMGHAVLHAGNFERALRRALAFLDVVLDGPLGQLRIREGRAEIVLADPHGPRSAFAYRTYWLIVLGLMSWLVGRRIALARVEFSCEAPPNRSDYHQFFGAPVTFGQSECSLSFSTRYLSLPTIRSEEALARFLQGAPANILLRYRHDQDISGRVRAHLRATPFGQWPGFDALAATLSLSPATLRRRLRAEGQSYLTICDELRHTEARRLLTGTDRTIADIAMELGYAEPGAFHRAFRKWAGLTPGQLRRAEGKPSR